MNGMWVLRFQVAIENSALRHAYLSQNMLQGDIENSKRIKPKKGGVAGRKLGISAGSDSEEDYKPVKAKAAAKPRAPAKPKVAAKEQQNKIEDFFKEAEGAAKKRGR